MAIFHLAYRQGSRAKGYSAGLHAEHLMGESPAQRGRPHARFIYAEHRNMPAWARSNPRAFWQAADRYERANGRFYTEIEVALPRELDEVDQINLARTFVAEQIGDHHPVPWAVHATDALNGGVNPYALIHGGTLDTRASIVESVTL